MLYNINDEFTKINETRGTIQNTSQCYSVEISDTAEENSGYLLHPLNRISFSGEVYLRCTESGGRAQVNVVSFITDSGGGGSGGSSTVDDSLIASDDEITNLIDNIFSGDSYVDDSEVAIDEDINALLENIFDDNAVDDSQIVVDDDIADLINNIFDNNSANNPQGGDDSINGLLDDIFG